MMGILSIFCILLWLLIDNKPLGIIIDNRNFYSLSKFQMLGWTILVMSAWTVFVITRMRLGGGIDAAGVIIDEPLVALMGISVTSMVAAPVLLNMKTNETPSTDPSTLGENGSARGNVYVRNNRDDARFIDIFRGDDVSNYNIPDISKIQQIIVTLVVMLIPRCDASASHRLGIRARDLIQSDRKAL